MDEISTDIPIYVDASDGHSGLANSKALELAGITANTSNPEQGIIERDPNTGAPSGTLRESVSYESCQRHNTKRHRCTV